MTDIYKVLYMQQAMVYVIISLLFYVFYSVRRKKHNVEMIDMSVFFCTFAVEKPVQVTNECGIVCRKSVLILIFVFLFCGF